MDLKDATRLTEKLVSAGFDASEPVSVRVKGNRSNGVTYDARVSVSFDIGAGTLLVEFS